MSHRFLCKRYRPAEWWESRVRTMVHTVTVIETAVFADRAVQDTGCLRQAPLREEGLLAGSGPSIIA